MATNAWRIWTLVISYALSHPCTYIDHLANNCVVCVCEFVFSLFGEDVVYYAWTLQSYYVDSRYILCYTYRFCSVYQLYSMHYPLNKGQKLSTNHFTDKYRTTWILLKAGVNSCASEGLVARRNAFNFPLWTFHWYVATLQHHLHMEYISLSYSDLMIPTMTSLILNWIPVIITSW
jgi:hypothetical protein